MAINPTPPAELLVLPERLADTHEEFSAEHVTSVRQMMRAELSFTDMELYESIVDRVDRVDTNSEDYKFCCEALGRLFAIDQREAQRFHDRFDALRGIRVSSIALTAVRKFELSGSSLDYADQISNSPFETRVRGDHMRFRYPHWELDDSSLHVDHLSTYFVDADGLNKANQDTRRYFFTNMRFFLQGIHKLQHSKLPLIHLFADASMDHLMYAERAFERELFLVSAGYMKKAADLLEDRLAFLHRLGEFRATSVAYECVGVNLKTLSPAGREAYIDGMPQIAEELRLSTGEADVPEVTQRLARTIAMIERQPMISDLSLGDNFGLGIA